MPRHHSTPRGDATADRDARFAEVVRTFEAPLSRYLVRMVGDAELARDLAQDTFLSAFANWPDPEPEHLRAWLYRIATNHALTHLRRRKVIRWVPLSQLARRGRDDDGGQDGAAPAIDYLFPSTPAPGDGIDEADAIESILDAMDPRDRATLLLHAAGFSGAEIGAQLNGTPASARTRLSRARAHFREQYARLAALTRPSDLPAYTTPRSTESRSGARRGTTRTAPSHLTLLPPPARASPSETTPRDRRPATGSDGVGQ
ncbi:MAG TPA: sigma-70 family RNA polymerase sigma factor [Thermomicrobiales bacterium]|jgi:RNA polymerase sigma-70 factor (ECF subfamily)|nr:sigma-70 family RNA polymerase sigma factor [Thermomicrobiales bacterium]